MIDKDYFANMKDVVDEVYERLGGKYTREQIFDVFDASISYIHSIMKYTDNMAIRIPHIGHMWVNEREMMMRRDCIKKYMSDNMGKAPKLMLSELENIDKRLKEIPEDLPRGHPLTCNVVRSRIMMRRNTTWDKLQKFQNKVIF